MKSRTDNAIKNIKICSICQVLNLVAGFVARTIFSKQLGVEYLGVSGLFTNILTILSFAELGIGSAIVYRLYKPLAENDYKKISQYMSLYKKVYNIIATVILILGLCLVPFLKFLIDAPDIKESISIIYVLYLLNTVCSYLLIYKRSLLIANQKSYIVSLITQTTQIVFLSVQSVLLIITHDFILYCILNCVCTIISNLICSFYVNKTMHLENNYSDDKLSKEEVRELFFDVKGLLLTKIAGTILGGTDNLFISSFIGIKYVGIISNYTLIITIINNIMNQIFSSLTSIVGNLIIEKDGNDTYNVFKKMFFSNATLYTYVSLGMILMLEEFVTKIWLDSDYSISFTIIAIVVFELYMRSLHYPLTMMRNAYGLFSQMKIICVIAAVLNIILDFALVGPLGIFGLYVATIVCRFIIYFSDIYVVFNYGLKKSYISYIFDVFKWVLFLICCCIVSKICIQVINMVGILGFIIKVIIITVIYTILYLLCFYRNKQFKQIFQLILKRIER